MTQDSIKAPQFPPTRWSVVLAAAGSGEQARAALEELCRLYWFPLYAFARQHGCSPEDAEDETQDFMARVAVGGLFGTAAPCRGRLRTYLLSVFEPDLIDAHRRDRRQKRGGHIERVPLEALDAEERYRSTFSGKPPAITFERAWATACLDHAMGLLQAEYEGRGRAALFLALRPFLQPEAAGNYAAASQNTGLDPNAMRQAVFRLRQRFRALLRQIIADTLEHPSESLIDEEIAALRAALAA